MSQIGKNPLNTDGRILSKTNSSPRRLEFKHLANRYGTVIPLIVLVLLMAIIDPPFTSSFNLQNLLSQIAVNGLLAIGEALVILTAGIDLSVGSVAAFSGVIAASIGTLNSGALHNLILGIVIAVFMGTIVGFVNGILIALVHLEPFVVTLATLAAVQGLTYVYSGGQTIGNLPNSAFSIGNGVALGLPIPSWIFFGAFLVILVVMSKTIFGRRIYAVGGNEVATRISGVNVSLVKITAYAISGFLASVAGILLMGRVDAGLPQAANGYELNAIAAVVIGGISLSGGRGKFWGVIIGALFLGVISNSMDLLNVNAYWQGVVEGVVILLAVLLDMRTKRVEVH